MVLRTDVRCVYWRYVSLFPSPEAAGQGKRPSMLSLSPAALIQTVIIVMVSLTVHELAHFLVTLRLGDDTPRRQGRLTLNPLAHIDLVGLILLVGRPRGERPFFSGVASRPRQFRGVARREPMAAMEDV